MIFFNPCLRFRISAASTTRLKYYPVELLLPPRFVTKLPESFILVQYNRTIVQLWLNSALEDSFRDKFPGIRVSMCFCTVRQFGPRTGVPAYTPV